MAAKKASKSAARKKGGASKRSLKDLGPGARRAKAVRGGLLPAVNLAMHNYRSLTSQITQKVNPGSTKLGDGSV
jgi:hypothetical protein